MKKFKDLINEVTVEWFQAMVKDKFNDLAKNPKLDIFNNQLMNVSKVEYNQALDATLADIKSLETYADIVSYVRLNKINLTDTIDAAKLQEAVLQGGLKSLPNLLIKIQVGYVAYLSETFFDEVRMWQDKLGRETEIDQIQLDDFHYLVNLSLSKTVDLIKSTMSSKPEVWDEIGEELSDLSSQTIKLAKKRQDFTIVKIYFNKLRDQLFANISPSVFSETGNDPLPANLASSVQELEKAHALVSQLEFILDYGSQVDHKLIEATKSTTN